MLREEEKRGTESERERERAGDDTLWWIRVVDPCGPGVGDGVSGYSGSIETLQRSVGGVGGIYRGSGHGGIRLAGL